MKFKSSTASTALRWVLIASSLLMVGGIGDSGRKRVKDGVSLFKKREFTNAARAFADAERLLPDDFRVKFNRGCAETRIQNREDAVRLLSLASTSPDREVALAAHYNLGNIDVLKAINEFGQSPDSISDEKRERGFEILSRAVRHYRECLAIDPDNIDARKNIEIIRLWQANMRKIWRNRERTQKEQEEKKVTLLQVLVQTDAAQFKAFSTNADLLKQQPDSSEAMEQQQATFDLYAKLPEKIDQQFAMGSRQDEEQRVKIREARETIFEMYSKAKQSAREAEAMLQDGDKANALASQAKALDSLNQMHAGIAVFPEVVQHAVKLQKNIVHSTGLVMEPADEVLNSQDGNTILERESRVQNLAAVLIPKAEQFAALLDKQVEESEKNSGVMDRPNFREDMSGFRTAIKRTKELNVELNEELTASSEKLAQLKLTEAAPHATRALELLEQIAETLPKKENGGKGNNQQQQQQDQSENQGENQDENEDNSPKDDGALDSEDPEEKQEQQSEEVSEKQKQQIRSREEAERLLRQVRDREQALKDRKATLRALRARQSKVKRDW